MFGNRRAHAYAVLMLVSALLALPAPALAGSGGGALGGPPSAGGSGGGTGATSTGPVTATGNGITLDTNASTTLRTQLTFSGSAPASAAGKTIRIQRLGHQTNWQWAQTATTTVGADGSFSVTWNTNHIGRFSIRALIGSSNSASSAGAAPTVTVTVYRVAIATLYGPGFWGQRTACGERLRRTMIGVANRTLKCGTKVAMLYHGRTLIVPVIDRGPYANHADWDLTMATAKALGINSTERIGAVSLPRAPGVS